MRIAVALLYIAENGVGEIIIEDIKASSYEEALGAAIQKTWGGKKVLKAYQTRNFDSLDIINPQKDNP